MCVLLFKDRRRRSSSCSGDGRPTKVGLAGVKATGCRDLATLVFASQFGKNNGSIWSYLDCFSTWFLVIAVFDRQCVTPMVAEHSPAPGAAELRSLLLRRTLTAQRCSTEVKPQKKSRLASRAAWPAVLAMAGATGSLEC